VRDTLVPLLVKALSKVPFGANEVVKLLVRIVREVLNDHAHIQSHVSGLGLSFGSIRRIFFLRTQNSSERGALYSETGVSGTLTRTFNYSMGGDRNFQVIIQIG
jgi:hypothetical protein